MTWYRLICSNTEVYCANNGTIVSDRYDIYYWLSNPAHDVISVTEYEVWLPFCKEVF